MIVQGHVAMQGRPQVLARLEAMGLQDVADAAIEAFGHAVGLDSVDAPEHDLL